jgi:hypothetical protein
MISTPPPQALPALDAAPPDRRAYQRAYQAKRRAAQREAKQNAKPAKP